MFSISSLRHFVHQSNFARPRQYTTRSRIFRQPQPQPHSKQRTRTRTILIVTGYSFVGATLLGAFIYRERLRHLGLATVRCTRIGIAAFAGVYDYKTTFSKQYNSEEERLDAYSQCHSRSAQRVLKALLANGGLFIKLGQHISSIIVLPIEWRSTMRPLQDQCEPSSMEALQGLFIEEMGLRIDDIFSEFNPVPVGVASLAQVHVATLKESGEKVAVKLQHPHIQEFAEVDMDMTEWILEIVKVLFPDFEFSWLGREMRENLPLELDFTHEALNASRVTANFASHQQTPLYIPKVLLPATRRTLVMEFIEGGRVDDKEYLAKWNIDRNTVSLELAKIFAEMVHLHGFFHADPHAGNMLIRPSPRGSRSPFNFEIALLDHGLYFDIDPQLRVDYSRFWLSLLSPPTEANIAERRKYAKIVGNIEPDKYHIFEAVITGRAAGSLEGRRIKGAGRLVALKRATAMLDIGHISAKDLEKISKELTTKQGLLADVFGLLRGVPRRVIMLLKLNDLTRSLDDALSTTHPPIRVFLIVAQYCNLAIWHDDRRKLIDSFQHGAISPIRTVFRYMREWFAYQGWHVSLRAVEFYMDMTARGRLIAAWWRGLTHGGFGTARRAWAGLA